MLVLTRRDQESIIFGEGEIVVRVLGINGSQVKLGIDAPRDVVILREELLG